MKISIATFNAENLITAGKPIYDEPDPYYNQDQYQKKTNWIKNQLLKMKADIVGFQEIFEELALRECIPDEMKSWHLFVANPTGRSPVNAILSKFPLIKIEVIENLPFVFDFFDEKEIAAPLESIPVSIPLKKFSRGVLNAEIKLNENISVSVIVLHLKSKRPILADGIDRNRATYPELAKGSARSLIRRAIESCGVRQILSDEINSDDKKSIFVLGDLNDNDTAVTNQAILGEEPFRKLPREEKLKKWKHVFQNCKDVQARKSIENFYYTYIHNGHYESLDNIFVSNHFAELNANKIGRIIDVRLYNDHVIDDKTSMDKKPIHVTDHGQVVANIDLFEPALSVRDPLSRQFNPTEYFS